MGPVKRTGEIGGERYVWDSLAFGHGPACESQKHDNQHTKSHIAPPNGMFFRSNWTDIAEQVNASEARTDSQGQPLPALGTGGGPG